MRWIICLFLVGTCLYGESPNGDTQTRIKKIQEEIAVYQNRARFAKREADRLMTLDFSSYRRYLIMQQRNEEEAAELQIELDRLQGKKRN